MLVPFRQTFNRLFWGMVTLSHTYSLAALENGYFSVDARILTALINPSATFLFPLSGIQIKPGIEIDLAFVHNLLNQQEIFYQLTPTWRAARSEKSIYSNLGYRKTLEKSQVGLHVFTDWNALEPTGYLHSQWGLGVEWAYLKKHRLSLISAGHMWRKSETHPNPSVRNLEILYAFHPHLRAPELRASFHYSFHKATVINDNRTSYNHPIKAALQGRIPFYLRGSSKGNLSPIILLLEPSYLRSTKSQSAAKRKNSDLSFKVGIQFSIGSSAADRPCSWGCLRSLITPTVDRSFPFGLTVKEQNKTYTVYPTLIQESKPLESTRAAADDQPYIPLEDAQTIQDFWNENTFTWYQKTNEGNLQPVGKGPTLSKEGLTSAPLSVVINGEGADSLAPVAEITLIPSEPTVVEHTDGETYETGNLLTIYSKLSIEPTQPTEYGLLPLKVKTKEPTLPNRGTYLGYNMEKIIATLRQNGEVALENWTPRSIINPLLEINAQYYCVHNTTLEPFQTLVLAPCPKTIYTLNFVDPSPLGKFYITEFEDELEPQAYQLDETQPEIVPATDDKQVTIMNEKQVANFNASLCAYKRALNRLDLLGHFFGVINQKVDAINGLKMKESDPYHILLPEGRTAYAMHAYKSMIALPWQSWIGMFTTTGGTAGYATVGSAHRGNVAMMRFADYIVNTPSVSGVTVHEMHHTFSYGHHGGLTYGWSDELEQYINAYYVPEGWMPSAEDPVPSMRAAEKQSYFASYHWTDPTHIEVQFYSLTSSAPPLTQFVIFSWDESYLPATGTQYRPILAQEDDTTICTCEAVVQDYSQTASIEQINQNCLRIALKQPRISHGSSIVLLASAASEPPYAVDDSLALIIYPRLRNIILPAIDFSNYGQASDGQEGPPHPWNQNVYDAVYMELTEEGYNDLFLNSGNTGHVGRVAEQDLDYVTLAFKQGFLPHAKYYKPFSVESAIEQAVQMGYGGLGTYPAVPTKELMSKFACQFMHLPRVLGLDPTTQEPCLMEYSEFYKGEQLTLNDSATLLLLKK